MIIKRSRTFSKDYKRLSQSIRNKADRQLIKLVNDWQHPSLHTKKMKGYVDVWEARVDYHNRITFQKVNNFIILRTIGPHDILKKP